MRSKDVEGKRIVRVVQQRTSDGDGCRHRMYQDLIAIVLDDGTELYVVTVETETGEYGHTIHRRLRRP